MFRSSSSILRLPSSIGARQRTPAHAGAGLYSPALGFSPSFDHLRRAWPKKSGHDSLSLQLSPSAIIMKPLLLVPLFVLSSSILLRATPAESRITAATVYADRAVVTRLATVELAAGEHAIAFERLPAGLLDQSLQASGRGTAGATILDVNAQTAYVDFTPNARVQELEEQLRGLQKQQRTLDDRGADSQRPARVREAHALGLDRHHHLSARRRRHPRRGTAARPTLDEWQKLYAYSEETFGKIATELQSLDSQREDLKAKQDGRGAAAQRAARRRRQKLQDGHRARGRDRRPAGSTSPSNTPCPARAGRRRTTRACTRRSAPWSWRISASCATAPARTGTTSPSRSPPRARASAAARPNCGRGSWTWRGR